MEAHARWATSDGLFPVSHECQVVFLQISDFGMARDLEESSYYISHGGKIPVKWTAPEVALNVEESIDTVVITVVITLPILLGFELQEVLYCQ